MIFVSEIVNKTKHTFKHLLFRSTLLPTEYAPDYIKQEAFKNLMEGFLQHVIENKSEYISYPLIDDVTDVKVLSISAYVISERDFADIIEDIYHRIYLKAYKDGITKGIQQVESDKLSLSSKEVKYLIQTLSPDMYDEIDIDKHIEQIIKDRKNE